MKKLVPFLIVIILFGLLFWFLCKIWPGAFFCPPCPTEVDCERAAEECVDDCDLSAPSTILIDDLHYTAWMPFDNDFALENVGELGKHGICTDTTPTDERNFGQCTGYADTDVLGLVIQIGALDTDYFKQIEIHQRAGKVPVVLASDDFDWLDVRPAGSACTIDAAHAYSLLPSELVVMSCDDEIAELPEDCRRHRRVHAALDPTHGLVTVWGGDNLFHIEPSEAGHDFGYTISLCDEVIVDVWKNGCFERRIEDVSIVHLIFDGPSDHSTFHIPPTDGGSITTPPITTP